MKRLAWLIAVIFILGAAALSYYYGFSKGKKAAVNATTASYDFCACYVDSDCVERGITCQSPEVPRCEKVNMSNGHAYDRPVCACRNPKLDY